MMGNNPISIKILGLLIFAVAVMGLCSCYYDTTDELFDFSDCQTENMSYQNNIAPIIANHCLDCHNAVANLGGVTLETYTDLKMWVDNGRILGAIQHLPGFIPMPQVGDKLSDCQIDKIESWIEDGAPNN